MQHVPGIARLAAAFTLGSAVGYLFSIIGSPLPWILGPLSVAATIAILMGGLHPPIWMRAIGQAIIAAAVALNVTAATAGVIFSNLVAMLASALIMVAIAVSAARWLAARGTLDRASAIFSILPGGAVEMAVLAELHGGNGAFVAFAQTLRVASIVVVVPFLLLALGLDPIVALSTLGHYSIVGAFIMVVTSVLPSLVLWKLKVANSYFVGPLIGVALCGLAGLPRSDIPQLVVVCAQVTLGVCLGAMFDRQAMLRLGAVAFRAAAISGCIIATGMLIALCYSGIGIGDLSTMILANAPGSVAEMAIVAGSMGLSPALVAAYHLIRIFVVVPFAPLIYRLAAR